ncbi:peptidoglycan-binding domain-containing protein [Agromyces larvae]|uniref:Peptidoglycan-binding protein n=1 Tax=Agromyces larvae TaxID=2929802 RepID=A0ABY4BWE0_9MICO|nr:peptidoglycan-binding domain-containing protein [Agromyces larvae]UOE43224.1 peptidoglycan-binding protein [Agromyces larvae]
MNLVKKTFSVLGGVALAATLAVAPVSPAAAATDCVDNVYKYGGYSSCVGDIQKILNLAHSVQGSYRLKVDNSFGANTRNSVKWFQSSKGLTADGVVGPKTWQALCAHKFGYGTAAFLKSAYAAQDHAGC